MCVEYRKLTWMLLLLSGAFCRQWGVNYQQKHICAVKDSTVVIPCSFYYPVVQMVTRVMWGRGTNIYAGPFIFDSKMINASSKFQYSGDKRRNCSLKIHHVQLNDAEKYAFRFVTDTEEGKWTGAEGSTLKVVDLNVSWTNPNGDGTIKEGDSVKLTCLNSCDAGHASSAFTWFKNGKPVHEGPVLHLTNVSSANSGKYTCSLSDHSGTTSGVLNIDVEYGPKNTSVSVTPSMEVDAGSNITLICSSHANPPVESYIWFKIDNDGITDVGHQPVLFSGEGGQYLCSACNKHGSQNSSVVTVKIKEHWTFNWNVLTVHALAVPLIVATAFAIRRLKKKVLDTDDEDIQDTMYTNWPVLDNNQSQEENQCNGAAGELIYTTVDFHTQRTSNTGQQMDPHHDEDNVIYSIVCK